MKTIVCLLALAAASLNAEERFVNTPSGKVRYQNWGKGEKALVFVHGWTCTSDFWVANANGLKDGWRILAVDLPGHGRSDAPDVTYTMAFLAKGVEAAMRDAGVTKAVLIGHSMGSTVIRHVYEDVPGQVAAMVIVDGSVARKGYVPRDRSAMYQEMRDHYEDNVTKAITSMFSD